MYTHTLYFIIIKNISKYSLLSSSSECIWHTPIATSLFLPWCVLNEKNAIFLYFLHCFFLFFFFFCKVFLDVPLLDSNQHALTSSTGSRAVGPHYAPAVVGLPLSTRHCVLPQYTWVLPLQQNLYGTSHTHLWASQSSGSGIQCSWQTIILMHSFF